MRSFLSYFFIVIILFFARAQIASAVSIGGAAVVIIDMQDYFVARMGYASKSENEKVYSILLKQQLKLIKRARKNKLPIIFLEHRGLGVTGFTVKPLKKAVSGYKYAVFFEKTSDGAFDEKNKTRKKFVRYLEKNQIDTLIIAGANGGSCVRSTIEGALKNSYNVIAFCRGIADFNFKNFIYPYTGRFDELEGRCAGCTFEEVDAIKVIFTALRAEPGNETTTYNNETGQHKAISTDQVMEDLKPSCQRSFSSQ